MVRAIGFVLSSIFWSIVNFIAWLLACLYDFMTTYPVAFLIILGVIIVIIIAAIIIGSLNRY